MIRSIKQIRRTPPAITARGNSLTPQTIILAGLTVLIGIIVGGDGRVNAETPTGTLVGRILYRGPIPPDRVVPVTRDVEHCGATVTIRPLSVHPQTAGLADAVVSIDKPLSPTTAPPAQPIVTRNHRCAFAPPVSVGRVGQPLELHNDDPVMHNTHITTDGRTFLNVALVPAGRPVRKVFARSGVYLVTCDAHKFMTAHVMVLPHSTVSTTDADGAFQIPNLPPGPHTITVWHSALGTLQRTVEIPPRGHTTLTIEFPTEGLSHDK